MTQEFSVKKLSDWKKAAVWLHEQTPTRKTFFLYGDMGVGKTTFVKSFCTFLKIKTNTSSPTFSIVNKYVDAENHSNKVYHIDLYRLKSLEEALDMGIEEYLYDDAYFCFIEWPQLIENLAPIDTVRIKINLQPDSSRKIIVLQDQL